VSDVPPAHYKLLVLKSAFAHHLGEFYERISPTGRSVAIRVQPQHCNSQGVAHGGFLLALADLALSYGTYDPGEAPPRITLSISTDFAGVARQGEWVEAHVDVQKAGRRVIFANCFICVGEKRIVRASGVFVPERAE
jgi:acyl-coenzyme A thioesterase 13